MRGAWFLVLLAACTACGNGIGPKTELVLRPGDSIAAHLPSGPLTIDAPTEGTRHIRFLTSDATLQLGGRASRWYGSLGGLAEDGYFGIGAGLIAEEAQYDFSSVDAFLFWLGNYSPSKRYTSDGYVIGADGAPNGTIDIDLYRVCIAERFPTHLPGARDDLVRVRHGAAADPATVASYGCARVRYDPYAEALRNVRDDFDSARDVESWGRVNNGCPLNGPTMNVIRPSPPGRGNELVLRPGDRLVLHNVNGTLSVDAPNETTRTYRWRNVVHNTRFFGGDDLDAHVLTASLVVTQTRDEGERGADACTRESGDAGYDAAIEEAQLNFASEADFRAWYAWVPHGPLYLDYGYSGDGVVAGYVLGADGGSSPFLSVDIFGICIAGKRAGPLAGLRGGQVAVQRSHAAHAPLVASYACAKTTFPLRSETENEERMYEPHSAAVVRLLHVRSAGAI
jgi:hypothetical protein